MTSTATNPWNANAFEAQPRLEVSAEQQQLQIWEDLNHDFEHPLQVSVPAAFFLCTEHTERLVVAEWCPPVAHLAQAGGQHNVPNLWRVVASDAKPLVF